MASAYSANTSTTSAANGAATITVTVPSGAQAKLYRLDAFTSAGTSTVTVKDGSTTIWTSATGAIGTTMTTYTWTPRPLTGGVNNTMTITGTAAGVGNTVTLNGQIEVAVA